MYHFIVNRNASSGQGMQIWRLLEAILKGERIKYKAHFPMDRRDAIQITRKLTSQLNEDIQLIVVGGDGTINGVLQGVCDFQHTILSCIPVGSGNDFARALGISARGPETLLHLLHFPEEEKMDYGEVSVLLADGSKKQCRFLISSGLGYDAEICQEVNEGKSKEIMNRLHLGKLSYVLVGLKRIWKKECCDVKVTFDDQESLYLNDMFLTVIMNTPFEGGGVPFCPMADWKDGYFDICMVSNLSKLQILVAIALVYIKKHYIFSQINHHRCRKIKMQMKKSRWIHIDGETPCKTRVIEMECKRGLRIIK